MFVRKEKPFAANRPVVTVIAGYGIAVVYNKFIDVPVDPYLVAQHVPSLVG